MNLQQTVNAIKNLHTEVAIDLGEHIYCTIESNCPLAIQLRRMMSDIGITLPQLLESFQEIEAPDPVVPMQLMPFNANISVTIGGKSLEVNMNDVIDRQLKESIVFKLESLEALKNQVSRLAQEMYANYINEIRKVGRTKVIPQLKFPVDELIKHNIRFTSDGNNYIFIQDAFYHPEYIINDGNRFQISNEHAKTLQREVVLIMYITPARKFLSIGLFNLDGSKFRHYHGTGADCWGSVSLPKDWDGSLRSLSNLGQMLMNSLVTINRDSLMTDNIPSFPHISNVMEDSKLLGREGEFDRPAETVQPGRPPGWGNTWGRRT